MERSQVDGHPGMKEKIPRKLRSERLEDGISTDWQLKYLLFVELAGLPFDCTTHS